MVLGNGQLQLADEIERIKASHAALTVARDQIASVARQAEVILERRSEQDAALVVRRRHSGFPAQWEARSVTWKRWCWPIWSVPVPGWLEGGHPMIWLAWRTHRGALITALVFLGIVATFMVITGLMMRADFTSLGLSACNMLHPSLACGDAWATFSGKYDVLTTWNELFTLTPLVVGILVGAPLVARELERKTSLLVWTQGVTRMRWLVGMLLGIFAGTIALFAAFSLLNTWWLHPFIQLDGRFNLNI